MKCVRVEVCTPAVDSCCTVTYLSDYTEGVVPVPGMSVVRNAQVEEGTAADCESSSVLVYSCELQGCSAEFVQLLILKEHTQK